MARIPGSFVSMRAVAAPAAPAPFAKNAWVSWRPNPKAPVMLGRFVKLHRVTSFAIIAMADDPRRQAIVSLASVQLAATPATPGKKD